MSSIEEVLTVVSDCWCDQLGNTVSSCCLLAGRPILPDCCPGYGWTRFIGAYPSVSFPTKYATADRCRIDTWAVIVEVGVARCAPEPCDPLGPNCCDAELLVANTFMDDFARFRRVFSCCLPTIVGPEGRPIVRQDEIIINEFKMLGPEGLCVQAVGQATLFVSDPCNCI